MLNLAAYCRYWWYRLRYPEVADYVSMGLGIQARFNRCRLEWAPHLRCSREFVERATREVSGGEVAVLGAGRLLDIDIDVLTQRFSSVRLYDYDLSTVSWWNKAHSAAYPRVSYHLTDLTGSMSTWTQKLRELLARCDQRSIGDVSHELMEVLYGLRIATPTLSADTMISLNLLGQLGVYWSDRVEALVIGNLGRQQGESVLANAAVQTAIGHTVKILEAGHVALLQTAATAILITDLEYFFYSPVESWWQAEPALSDGLAANFGESRTFEQRDSWHWHIAPCGREESNYGEIHRVVAYSWSGCRN